MNLNLWVTLWTPVFLHVQLCSACVLSQGRLHRWSWHPVCFLFFFFCCRSGLDHRVYSKAPQSECSSSSSSRSSAAPPCVCLCVCASVKAVKMQRVYMHSNEHFEVFTTVLAPRGELCHICRRVSVGGCCQVNAGVLQCDERLWSGRAAAARLRAGMTEWVRCNLCRASLTFIWIN